MLLEVCPRTVDTEHRGHRKGSGEASGGAGCGKKMGLLCLRPRGHGHPVPIGLRN